MISCERCFASVPATEVNCPECGAPMKSARPTMPMADNALHTDLARVNLLRVRGEYKSAEDQCLSILKRFPNSDAAHTLMGDIYADQAQWAQAAEWYELALDISPDSAGDKQKLEEARRHLAEREDQETVEQLGLPKPSTNIPVIALGIVAIIVVFAFIAFLIGQKAHTNRNLQPISGQPIEATPDAPASHNPKDSASTEAGRQTPVTAGSADEPLEDRTAMQTLARSSADGGRILSVQRDPRAGLLAVTYSVKEGEDERHIGAQIAKEALDQIADASMVTIRATRAEHIVYVADVYRQKITEIESSAWQTQNGSDSDAWINEVLTHEWPARTGASGATSGTTGGTADAATTSGPAPGQ